MTTKWTLDVVLLTKLAEIAGGMLDHPLRILLSQFIELPPRDLLHKIDWLRDTTRQMATFAGFGGSGFRFAEFSTAGNSGTADA